MMMRIRKTVGKAIGVVAALLCFGTATALADSINLSEVTADTTVADGTTLTGTLGENVKISIADGATVTLKDVTITNLGNGCHWAGINCPGDAILVLEGANTVCAGGNSSGYHNYPGIWIAPEKTLTIQGDGSLVAYSGTGNAAWASGIGGGYEIDCGNIVIEGGTITATGGKSAAGIGCGYHAACGDIIINGGTITATGGRSSAGIGCGYEASCGNIVITGGTIASTGGMYSSALGGGYAASCGDITIASTVTSVATTNTPTSGAVSDCIGAGTEGGTCGTVTIGGVTGVVLESPYTFMPVDLSSVTEGTTIPNGATLCGTLASNVKISIAPGATVTLGGANLNGDGTWTDGDYAGITCEGNATIILWGENNVKGFNADYPGIYVPEGSTLTIQGGGALDASSNGAGAGIGGGNGISCGNIVIAGGVITATGGTEAAGIGGGSGAACGDITITDASFGVTASKGEDAPYSIGAGKDGSGGTVTIGNEVGAIEDSPYTCNLPIDLSNVTAARTIPDGKTITGTLGATVKISIARYATVTLKDATINGVHNTDNYYAWSWAGITCEGDATIILEGENAVRGFCADYPGIFVPVGSTLTIQGEGSLDASSNGWGAGIGGGDGSEYYLSCGNIVIEGGTIVATGGKYAAAIGSGEYSDCGTITIADSVTSVKAVKGEGADCSIGVGYSASCDTVTLGGVEYPGGVVNSPFTFMNLAKLAEDTVILDGTTVFGTLTSNVKVSIADGATVTLKDVTIDGVNDESYSWAGLMCEGDATIILTGENTVKGFHENYPGIHVPEGSTLTIKGDGSLDASSNGYGVGIGGGSGIACGNIVIEGGTIVATGGECAAGIGGGFEGSCGNIEVNGGAITAIGGDYAPAIGGGAAASCGDIVIAGGAITATGGECAPGIGGGDQGSCGDITIADTVTSLAAIKGDLAPYSIGKGFSVNSTCGTVTIGGTVYADGITQSPYIYPSYTATLKDGTEDADNWTITPNEGVAEKDAVTVAYAGTNKVKSVKAVAIPLTLSVATAEDVGKVVCADGHLHDAKTAVPDGCTAVGILGKVTEKGHGLILALQNASSQTWNTINGWTSTTGYAGTTLKLLPDDAARGANLTSYTSLGETPVSNWAVAQKSDYEAIFTNLGSTTGDSDGKVYDANVNAYITTGVGGTAISGNYWSATGSGRSEAWRFLSRYWQSYEYDDEDSFAVRPVLGFGGEAADEEDDTADAIAVMPVEGKTNEWMFQMPAADVEVEVEYFTQEELNQIAVVEAAIDEIGTVDGSEEAAGRVSAARTAYDALADAAKAAVTNYALLPFAEAKVDAFGELDTLADNNTSQFATALIAAVRTPLAEMGYDTGKTLEANLASLENVLSKLGEVLDSIHAVSFAEGTPDAENWTIAPYADGKFCTNDTVTLAYGGSAMVKSVKAVAIPLTLSAATAEDVGKVVCADGHLHDAKTAVPDGCTAVGILGKVTEKGHGLILALQNASSQTWNTINGWTSTTGYAGTTLKVLPDDAARGANLTSYTTLGDTPVSDWAVGQKSDYEAIFVNLGSTTVNSGTIYDGNVNAYFTTGVGGTAISGDYWSATDVWGNYAWGFSSDYWHSYVKAYTYGVRPVLGFGGEATEEIAITPVEGKPNEWTFQMPDGDVEVEVAYLAVATFEVEGETYAVITNVVGEAVATPEEDPVKAGHSFVGWFTEATGGTQVTDETLMGIADTTFYAQFRAPILTIENGVLTAVDFNGCTDIDLVIPTNVTAIGDSAFYQCTGLASVTIPGSVKTISHAAFRDCSNLTSVTIEEGVTTIGERAFARCVNLASITISGTVTAIGEAAFSDCKSLTSLTIPGNVKTIEPQAFQNCTGLESVTLEEGVETIGRVAFDGCENLSSVTIPDSVKEIGDDAFAGCSDALYEEGSGNLSGVKQVDGWAVGHDAGSISENLDLTGVRGIAGGAFAGCDAITGVIIPDGVATIPEYAFNGCDNLTGVTIPDSVTSIGEGAFGGCDNLASVTIPDSVTSIGKDAFEGCSEELFDTTAIPGVALVDGWAIGYTDALPENLDLTGARGIASMAFRDSTLESVTIHGTVARVPAGAFMSCSSLASVTLEEGVTAIDDSAFIECSALESVEIPDTVTAIGPQAFVSCVKLASVKVPGSVAEIGPAAFGMCSSLTNITSEAGVTNIGMMAFAMCSALESLELPGTVTAIGAQAFIMSMNLESVTIPSSVMEIGQDAFLYTALSTVYVEYGDGDRVKALLAASGLDVSGLTFVEPLLLTFDPNGGEFAEDVETNRFIHAGAELGELPEATLTGYTLAGWFTAATEGDQVTATNTMGEADATIYAQWTINQYTISFDVNGGEGEFASRTLDYGSEYGELPMPLNGAWEFLGWFDAEGNQATAESVLGDSDVVLTAKWSTDAMLTVGEYFSMTLAELGVPVPTDGTVYNVKALGLPAGLKLKSNPASTTKVDGKTVSTKAKTTWWIEGVPTAALDYATNPAYVVVTVGKDVATYPLKIAVAEQNVVDLGELPLKGEPFVYTATEWLEGIEATGWTVSGLPSGVRYTEKGVGKTAPSNSVYGVATKAGLFTITAKKKTGSYYETLKFKVVVRPPAADESVFGELADRTSTVFVEETWNLADDVAAQGGEVVRVTGLPAGMKFSKSDVYAYSNTVKRTGRYVKQAANTIAGAPTKPGTYVVSLTKNVKEGSRTVAKTAQMLWIVEDSAEPPALTFNTSGGVIVAGSTGLAYDGEFAFEADPAAAVKASGLPSGISLVNLGDGSYAFSGYTSRTGTYLVTVTAKLNGQTVTERVAMVVEPLPVWAMGTFNGYVTADGESVAGSAAITINNSGRVSGKLQTGGKTWNFSAPRYTGLEDGKYTVNVDAKCTYSVRDGAKSVRVSETRAFLLSVGEDSGCGALAMTEISEDAGLAAYAWQNLWNTTYKEVGKAEFTGKNKMVYKTWTDVEAEGLGEDDTLALKVTTRGVVTATYRYFKGTYDGRGDRQYTSFTSSTVFVPWSYEEGVLTGTVFVYFPPNDATGFPGWQGRIDYPWDQE